MNNLLFVQQLMVLRTNLFMGGLASMINIETRGRTLIILLTRYVFSYLYSFLVCLFIYFLMVLDKFMFCSISSLKDSPSLIGESSKYCH
ncbi:calmodulin-binding transcription activator 1 isoform X1 [Iris pallida]|uniref:Calmodulin-binding transcription activator 1 isoform X1 n=1 Tax=Iris pallida TaxID=29817 RepID=A0AAX6EVZ8_IRIPA|nr:calmodulin-binding transcription activator 1 isoform X1 [Iris pallida]